MTFDWLYGYICDNLDGIELSSVRIFLIVLSKKYECCIQRDQDENQEDHIEDGWLEMVVTMGNGHFKSCV